MRTLVGILAAAAAFATVSARAEIITAPDALRTEAPAVTAPAPAPVTEKRISETTGMSEVKRGGGCRDIVVRTRHPDGTTMVRKLSRCD